VRIPLVASPAEADDIHGRMADFGEDNRSEFLRSLALRGFYLPDDTQARIEQIARRRGTSVVDQLSRAVDLLANVDGV